MKIISPKVEFITPINGNVILKRLEQCGRVCYKSEGRIEEGSAETFLKNIIKRGHEAVLEHGTFIFEAPSAVFYETLWRIEDMEKYEGFISFLRFTSDTKYIISGNVRAWRDYFKAVLKVFGCLQGAMKQFVKDNPIIFPEFQDVEFLKCDEWFKPLSVADLISENEKLTHWDVTVKFTCDRGVSHEIVRHRMASYCQESTRYCNYSKDDFDGEITVIKPCFFREGTQSYLYWESACKVAEIAYFDLLTYGCTPQEARSVLPNSLKTEVVMTANIREWRHFLKLRTAPASHPQMREVANMLLDMCKANIPILFDDIE